MKKLYALIVAVLLVLPGAAQAYTMVSSPMAPPSASTSIMTYDNTTYGDQVDFSLNLTTYPGSGGVGANGLGQFMIMGDPGAAPSLVNVTLTSTFNTDVTLLSSAPSMTGVAADYNMQIVGPPTAEFFARPPQPATPYEPLGPGGYSVTSINETLYFDFVLSTDVLYDFLFFANVGFDPSFATLDWVMSIDVTGPATPIPGAVWLLGSGLLGLVGLRKRFV